MIIQRQKSFTKILIGGVLKDISELSNSQLEELGKSTDSSEPEESIWEHSKRKTLPIALGTTVAGGVLSGGKGIIKSSLGGALLGTLAGTGGYYIKKQSDRDYRNRVKKSISNEQDRRRRERKDK